MNCSMVAWEAFERSGIPPSLAEVGEMLGGITAEAARQIEEKGCRKVRFRLVVARSAVGG